MGDGAWANPAAWTLVAGICLGGSLAFLIPRPRSSRRKREGRLAAAIAFLSLCVAGLTAGFVFCGPGTMVEPARLLVGAVAAAAALLGFSFPLAAGLPMAGVAGAWILALAVIFSDWIPVVPTDGAGTPFMGVRARGEGAAWSAVMAASRAKPGRPKFEARIAGDGPEVGAVFEWVAFAEVYRAFGLGDRVMLGSATLGRRESVFPPLFFDGTLKTYGPRLGIVFAEKRLEARPFKDFDSCGIVWTEKGPAWKP
jgi:hypothetical protein